MKRCMATAHQRELRVFLCHGIGSISTIGIHRRFISWSELESESDASPKPLPNGPFEGFEKALILQCLSANRRNICGNSGPRGWE